MPGPQAARPGRDKTAIDLNADVGEGFGRRSLAVPPDEIERDVLYQVGARSCWWALRPRG